MLRGMCLPSPTSVSVNKNGLSLSQIQLQSLTKSPYSKIDMKYFAAPKHSEMLQNELLLSSTCALSNDPDPFVKL